MRRRGFTVLEALIVSVIVTAISIGGMWLFVGCCIDRYVEAMAKQSSSLVEESP